MPDLTGLDEAGVLAALAAADLVPELVTVDGPAPLGALLAVEPATGTQVPPGATVLVRLASGYTTVPESAGLTPSAARSAVEAAGLQARMLDPADRGEVARTVPAAGTRVAVGAVVTLIGAAPSPSATQTATPSPSPEPTPGGSPPSSSPPGGEE
ncbi:MAG TPA: PASTA domain-containing protein [Actinotalea sp.]|nr:PASTA domain-containing protein [Actinotalea sp.]